MLLRNETNHRYVVMLVSLTGLGISFIEDVDVIFTVYILLTCQFKIPFFQKIFKRNIIFT